MIQNTFCHIQGIGLKSEQNLWKNGILSWDDVIRGVSAKPCRMNSRFLQGKIEESLDHLERDDPRYFGKLMPTDDAGYWHAVEWLMWQMGGFGPMLGQAHHFLQFNKGKAPYAEERYGKEANRLYGVLDKQLEGRDFIVGDYSMADIAAWPWASRWEWQGVDLNDFPNVKAWYTRIAERPAVQKGYDVPARGMDIPMP